MTDYRIFGAGSTGPSSLLPFSSGNGSVGFEFYVNQPSYLRFAHIWKNSSVVSQAMNVKLYQMTSETGFIDIKGNAGVVPAGYGGWFSAQMNPLLLVPGVRYKMAYFVGRYVHYQNNVFWNNQKWANGVGNAVVWAPGANQALGTSQMTYDSNAGYPTNDYSDTYFGLDVTVTDAGFPTPLVLGGYGTIARKRAATATLGLGASGTSTKRSVQSGTAYLGLRATGRSYAASTRVGTARLFLGASGVVTHRASIQGVAELQLGASATAYKTTEITGTAELHLAAPTLSDFYVGVSRNIRDALVERNWNEERQHFQEAEQVDAEALGADLLGGLMALSTGDRERAHQTVRHLRNFRVKGQQIAGGRYRNPTSIMGYKPYGTLGANAHPRPPQVIDQPMTWLAQIFKGNYGEPIGDDVHSLLAWHDTKIAQGASALYGAQFLGVNRTVWSADYKLVSRPQLASAAWGFLAASGASWLFPVAPLPRPQLGPVALTTRPSEPGRHRLDFSWSVLGDVPVTVYQNRLESRTDRYGPWRPVFEHLAEHQADEIGEGPNYAHVITVPQPAVTTQYRVWMRMRNALYGEWVCSNPVQIYSKNSALFPGPTTFPSPTTFPQG